jgi:enoyl-CoA hydratase
MQAILYERIAGLAIIRLNRPENLNALTSEIFAALRERLNQLQIDESLRVLILTGSGDKAFCAGIDIGALVDRPESEARKISKRGQNVCAQLENFPVPVVAAVNGIAAGGGCELALACHLRIASSSATFSLPETKLGLIPGYGGTQRLSREFGHGRAIEMMLTGKSIGAEQAMEIGLVNRIVPISELMSEVVSLGKEIETLSPLAIRACMKAVNFGSELPLDEGLALETELFASLFATDDVREGTRAFLEKRSPVFRGK